MVMTNSTAPRFEASVGSGDRTWSEGAFLSLVTSFVRELHPRRQITHDASLAAQIERDLGIDSLARSELALRIERRFAVRLPISAVGETRTVADLAQAVRAALSSGPDQGGGEEALPPAAPLPATAAAAGEWVVERDRLFVTPGPRLNRSVSAIVYAGWWWTVIATVAGLGWLTVMALPRRSWRWRVAKGLARLALAAIGARPSVVGAKHIPPGGAVLVFNHASYMDPLVLAAILPGEPVFVAKKEFSAGFLAGAPLRRLGVGFVDRYDTATCIADTAALVDRARRGELLVFSPEGKLLPRPGLAGFRLGAFKIAAEAGVPVVPGVIKGTRSTLRLNDWFPRKWPLRIEVAEPIDPPKTADFASIVALRDDARAAMVARSDEPDLNELIPQTPPGPAT